MNYYTRLDQDVKRLAKSRGLRLTDVYLMCGINSTTFNDIRKKNNCTTQQLFKLCEAFKVPITAFIHSKNTEPTNEVNDGKALYNNAPSNLLLELESCKKLNEEKDKRLDLYEKMIKRL